jgi:hypothetical protein
MVAMGLSDRLRFSGRLGLGLASRVIGLVLAGICVLGVTACGGSAAHGADRDHGVVVAELPIPLASSPGPVVHVAVKVGQRFSVKVDTSDGPYEWSQVGPSPDRQLVKPTGDFNDGHCQAEAVGCRVPYFHTLQAKARGTTKMTWHLLGFSCQNNADSDPDCTHNTVKFEITVS